MVPFFCFDDAEGFAVDEEHVVGGAAFGLDFADGDAEGGEEVEFVSVLHGPTSGL